MLNFQFSNQEVPQLLNSFEISFPHPAYAEPDGLLALGGDLRPERLLFAYQNGIFPWDEMRGEIAWYAPDPRFVLFPDELKIHKSMRSIFNQQKFEYSYDTHFQEVIRHCADVWRHGQVGSWISEKFIEGYTRLHELGLAHSVEVWREGELVGGLYGVCVGRVFCGESMFALVPNASKAGFITLVRRLTEAGFWMIDCQVATEHLTSLGAKNIRRDDFMEILARNQFEPVNCWPDAPPIPA